MKQKKGLFITLEGCDGAGKSTQVKLLDTFLTNQNIAHILTREPGGSEGAEEIRKILSTGTCEKWDAVSETLLFSAARRSHLVNTIWPALKQDKWVISDRFSDSTLAYQGYGRTNNNPLSLKDLNYLYAFIAGDFNPDLTFILDISPEIGLTRAKQRGEKDRFEKMDMTFHQNLRNGFLKIAQTNPQRYHIIDANFPPEIIHSRIVNILNNFIQK